VVGYYEDATNQKHAFLFDSASVTFADINDPAPTDTNGSVAESINGNGPVLGYYLDSRNDQIWFVYDSARNTFTQVNDPSGFNGSSIAAINNAGDLAGTFDQGSGPQPFIASLFQPDTVSVTVSIADNSGAILAFGAQHGTSFTLAPGQLGQLQVIAQQPGFHGLVALNVTGTGIEEDGSTTSTTSTMSVPALGPVTDPVLRWDQATLKAIATDASTPPFASRALAMESLAVYDTVTGIDGGHGYLVNMTAPSGASADAAVAAAADTILDYLYPAQAPKAACWSSAAGPSQPLP
jgi:hypothetical protein